MFADIKSAIQVEKRLGRGKAALKDLLGRVCAEYNRLTTIKKHRVDGPKKNLLYNLLLHLAWQVFVFTTVVLLIVL